MSEEYESVALVKPEVFIYRIPPLATNRGHKAADWKLDTPDWSGRLRLVAIGKKLELRLEDKNSGQLFAKAPIDNYPGNAIEAVSDSSRYFVLKLLNENGQAAFVGLGFADRGDSFDLNVALQDHFKYLEKSEELAKEESGDKPKLDLGFKDGQTITISLGSQTAGSTQRSRPSSSGVGGPVPLLPPPPGTTGNSTSPRQQRNVNIPSSTTNITNPALVNNDLFFLDNANPFAAESKVEKPQDPDVVASATSTTVQSTNLLDF